jgi:EmrB/QacA subfamily drug resistance transporter
VGRKRTHEGQAPSGSTERFPVTAPTREGGEKVDRPLVKVAIVTLLGSMMSIIDSTIVSVAIPSISHAFHASLATIQWTVSIYMLALAVVIALSRWIIDRFGARDAYLASLGLFIVGSALCGMSPSAGWLILFRALQGLGGGLILPVGQTILTRAAGPARMGRAMAVVGAPSAIGTALGPVLGGFLIESLGWRWIFYINVPIGILAIAWSLRVLEKDRGGARVPFDFVGLLLLPPGIALIIYALSEMGNAGAVTPSVLVGLVLGAAFIGLFALHSLRVDKPLLNLRLFKNRVFLTANLATFTAIAAAGGGPFLTSLYLQIARGYSPLSSGLFQGSLFLGMAVTTPFSGRILDRSGPRRLALSGLLIMALALVPWLLLTPTVNIDLLAAATFVRGLGIGCVFTPLLAAGYAALEPKEMPSATTVSSINQRMSNVIGVALMALVLQSMLDANLPAHHSSLGAIPTKGPLWASLAAGLSRSFSQTFIIYEAGIVLAFFVALSLPKSRQFGDRRAAAASEEPAEFGFGIAVEGVE